MPPDDSPVSVYLPLVSVVAVSLAFTPSRIVTDAAAIGAAASSVTWPLTLNVAGGGVLTGVGEVPEEDDESPPQAAMTTSARNPTRRQQVCMARCLSRVR